MAIFISSCYFQPKKQPTPEVFPFRKTIEDFSSGKGRGYGGSFMMKKGCMPPSIFRHSGPARSVGCRNLWKFLQGVPHLRHPGFGPPPHPCSAHRLHTRHSDSAPFPHSRHPGFLAQPKRPGSSVQEARMQSQVARSSTPFPVAKGNVHEIKAKTIEDPGLPAWQRETGMTGVE